MFNLPRTTDATLLDGAVGMIVLRPDRSYTSAITGPAATEREAGAWTAAPDESNRVVLTMQRRSGQRCAPRGGCRQMGSGEPQRLPLTPVNHDTFRLGDAGTLTRLPQR